jgi:hypothetical protein
MTRAPRLTHHVREKIADDALRYAFTEEIAALRVRRAALAVAVRADVLGPEGLRLADSLPAGWLREANEVGARFGATTTRLSFSGGEPWSSKIDRAELCKLFPMLKDVCLRMPIEMCGGYPVAYGAGDDRAREHDALAEGLDDLWGRVRAARASAMAALNSTTSFVKLREAWPEIAHFSDRYESAQLTVPNLPDVPRGALNAMLRLPVQTSQTSLAG